MPEEEVFFGSGISEPSAMIFVVGGLLAVGFVIAAAYAIYNMMR